MSALKDQLIRQRVDAILLCSAAQAALDPNAEVQPKSGAACMGLPNWCPREVVRPIYRAVEHSHQPERRKMRRIYTTHQVLRLGWLLL